MRKQSVLLACLIGAMAAAATGAEEPGASRLDRAFIETIKAGDIEALAALFDAEALMLPPGELPLKGQELIRMKWTSFLKANHVREARLSETGYRSSGKLSVGWGRFRLTLDPKKGGQPVNVEGRFSDVAENKGGKWVYVFMMMGDIDEPLTLRHYSGSAATP